MRVALFIFFALSVIPGSANTPSPQLIVAEDKSFSIGNQLVIAKDTSSTWSAAQALRSGQFFPSVQNVPNLGLGHGSYWILFSVKNSTKEKGPILHINNPEVDELDLHRVVNGNPYPIARGGLARPVKDRLEGMRDLAFDLGLKDSEEGVFLIRVKSQKQLRLPVEIQSLQSHTAQHAKRNLLLGIYIGIMVVLSVYNLFVYFSIRDRSYLTYVVYLLFVSLTQLTFLGITRTYLWPNSAWVSLNASLLLTIMTGIAASEFMRGFTRSRELLPRFDRLIPWFYAVFAISALLYITVSPIAGYLVTQVSAGAFATFLLIGAIQIMRSGSREAGFFLLAWSVFLVGTIVFLLKDMGILPYNSVTSYTMPIGAAVEGILLSFGLADRINILRREKEISQAQALDASLENERIIREQNLILESRVRERTWALEESNQNLKETQTQLVNSEKMASLGQLTAGIAHEINNPINFITSNVAPLKRNIKDIVEVIKGYQEVDAANAVEQLERLRTLSVEMDLEESISELDVIIASIAEGSSRTTEIVRGLRNFSRLDEGDLKEADLNEGLRNTLAVLAPQYRDKVDFSLELADPPKVECFPGKLNQVFMNIITNAAQATLAKTDPVQRKVTIRTSSTTDTVSIMIADNGTGMSEEVKARIFDPFFTTKDVGEGTGLGMAIVYGIINDHGGNITIDTTPGVGTEFTITLPLRQRQLQKSA